MKSFVLRGAWSAAALLVCWLGMGPASAQAPYPNQPIKFLVPYPPGGLPDTTARIVALRLQERIGHNVVIENRPGGASSVAVGALMAAPADGYTFIVTDGAIMSANPALFKDKLAYNPKDLVPVAFIGRAPLFLAVHPKLPVNTLQEFIDYVKARPGQINYGSSGIGSVHHLSMEAMKAALGLNMAHVPYRGTQQSVPALLGGHVDVIFSAYPSLVAAVEGKLVKLLATNGAKRFPQAPDVPALAEIIPGYDLATIVGLFARIGTPPALIEKLSAEAVAGAGHPDAVKAFTANGIEPALGGPDAFARALQAEVDYVNKVVADAGIKIE